VEKAVCAAETVKGRGAFSDGDRSQYRKKKGGGRASATGGKKIETNAL